VNWIHKLKDVIMAIAAYRMWLTLSKNKIQYTVFFLMHTHTHTHTHHTQVLVRFSTTLHSFQKE